MTAQEYNLFAVTAHGLAGLCAAELAAIGIDGTIETGGVAWRGPRESLYRANLELRTASRVIARAGEFRARGFAELERRAAKLPWLQFLVPGSAVALRVTCRKSKLYHEGAVAERVARVLGGQAGVLVQGSLIPAADDDDEYVSNDAGVADAGSAEAARPQLIIVRFMRDVCTISVDSSGALLHQRGYRQAIARAPLRETIAAAMLLASGWNGESPLIDPMCGSGTIPIESALLARDIAPGIAASGLIARAFAFETWPHFDPDVWARLVTSARQRVRPATVPILAADSDAGAITAARANAIRAGVADDMEFRRAAFEDLESAPGAGHIVTNPPYGMRVGERRQLYGLYARFGSTVRSRLPGWSVTMLAADDNLAARTGLPLEERLSTRNGGIPVRLLTTVRNSAEHAADVPV